MATFNPAINPQKFPVPESIETERLLIRPFNSEDALPLHQALLESINELRQYLWFLPWLTVAPTLQSAATRCKSAESNFRQRLDLPYLAFERTTGRLIGSVGLHRTDWEIPKTEVGYWIRSSEQGLGFATEGVNAITSWALHELEAKRVELISDEENAASRRVAEKCGFVLEGTHRNTSLAPDGSLRHDCVYARYQNQPLP